ncbi:related to puromycin-sensitive aminopeptidase and related aminopeptidases [Phialocephala subalpina]|uniref:Aminopeptidase n=1 Tax=Phialocephala subalpina TaxID=576137 RepID=A0A1L7XP37_9HELO|nr:related to puromycin-sensitive aminopeptidase and related aminopeptidases [Phialocephala subalpina]
MGDATTNLASLSIDEEREILPKNVRPTHYDLRFEPHLEEALDYNGSALIDLEVLEDTSSITVNALDLKIIMLEVGVKNGVIIATSPVEFDTKKERMIIKLGDKVKAGTKLYLKTAFKGSMLHRAYGFYRSPVEGPDGKTTWMASTHMEPVDCRKVFPCFDEPALKATFTVTLIADKNLTCLGNMDVASEVQIVSNGKQKKAVTFNLTPPMSTYLVAFAVGDLQVIETDSFRVPVRVYAAIDKNIQHGKYAVELASRTLAAFEKIFDVAFPLPKMDLIAVPGAQGAMENWGLVKFGESLLLVDEKETSAVAYRRAGSVIVHELAHQWFGNIVTMDFWEGLWLNESFADWAELYAWETLEPAWQMWQDYAIGGYQAGLSLDSNKASHPIEVPVSKVSQINQIFDDISYNKGCAVIRMIAKYLGTEKFIEGVQFYLKKHAYGNTKTTDLWDALSHSSGEDVGTLMETWTKQIGYPFVTVEEDDGKIKVTQHRFLQDGICSPEDDTVLYPLSLKVLTKDGVDDNLTLYERTKVIDVPSDFYKLNAGHTGFYRVLYTPERLDSLGKNAKAGLLPTDDKIGLLSDALALASSGYSKISTLLNLLKVFDEETNYFVWKQVFATLTAIMEAWTFEDESVSKGLKSFKNDLVRKVAKSIGWNFEKDDDTVEQMLKAVMFANSGSELEVRKAAKDMFDAFLAGDDEAININIRASVFAIALEHGSAAEYDAIFEALKTATSLDKRDTCIRSFGCSEDPALIDRTLKLSLTDEMVARNDTRNILLALTKHKPGKEALWNWLKTETDKIEDSLGHGLGTYARLVQAVVSALATREQYEDVKRFFEGKNTESYDKYLAQSMNKILAKANWVERDRDDMKAWLKENGYA